MANHFAPPSKFKGMPYSTDDQKYEGVKAKIDGQLVLVESCLGKCKADFNNGGLGPNGDVCMTKCYNKFFDSSLLVHKELTLYTSAINSAL